MNREHSIRAKRGQDHHVVMLVCSAGGLPALQFILASLPENFCGSVIVLQHQDPTSGSRLTEILGRRTGLPVGTAQEAQPLLPGHVLVAPSGMHTLIAHDGTVALIPSGDRPPYRPSADLLLTTAATNLGSRAVAVVLSGYGIDAATGATAIGHFGGTVIASDLASSQVFAMPQATIERDHAVDVAMPLKEIPSFLIDVTHTEDLA